MYLKRLYFFKNKKGGGVLIVKGVLKKNKKKKNKIMCILGDIIRMLRETTKESLEDCGFDDLKSELKDILEAIKGK